jgi:UDP-N-acetylglucosamine 2-epimerase (non-hydrolysing)
VRAGTAKLVGSDYKLALELIDQIKRKTGFYQQVKKACNPFGDGKASKRIVKNMRKICRSRVN